MRNPPFFGPSTYVPRRPRKATPPTWTLNPRPFSLLPESPKLSAYRVNLVDSAHIDAMAWMCNLLGMSGEASYRSLLDKVVRETPNRKIRNYASKSMRRLNR